MGRDCGPHSFIDVLILGSTSCVGVVSLYGYRGTRRSDGGLGAVRGSRFPPYRMLIMAMSLSTLAILWALKSTFTPSRQPMSWEYAAAAR
jgi:hypothetical protein